MYDLSIFDRQRPRWQAQLQSFSLALQVRCEQTGGLDGVWTDRCNSGYLGGATLQLLMDNPTLSVTALVRTPEKAEKLEAFGVHTVLGSLDDVSLLEREAAKADAIIQCVSCFVPRSSCVTNQMKASHDHVDGVIALLKGAKARFEQTCKQPIFIQTASTFISISVTYVSRHLDT